MSKVIYLDPSIARTIHIGPIVKKEDITILFTTKENWVGDYELSIYNSAPNKNLIVPTRLLSIVDKVMTLNIYPEAQSIPVGDYFYEIFNTSSKRIIVNGKLNILK